MNPSLLYMSPHTLVSAFSIGLITLNSGLVICTKMHIFTHIHVSTSYYYICVLILWCPPSSSGLVICTKMHIFYVCAFVLKRIAEYHRCIQVNEHRINLHFLEGVEKAGHPWA